MKYSKDIEREMSNADMQKDAYLLEQTKIIAEAIKKGYNDHKDFQFALEKVKIKKSDKNGKEIEINGYDYLIYLEKLLETNKQRDTYLKKVSESDYQSVTRLQEAIDILMNQHEEMRSKKGRLDRTLDIYNKRRK